MVSSVQLNEPGTVGEMEKALSAEEAFIGSLKATVMLESTGTAEPVGDLTVIVGGAVSRSKVLLSAL